MTVPLPLPRLHVLTAANQRADDLRTIDAVLDAGAPAIQIRVKDHTDRDHLAVVRAIVARCRRAGSFSVVNDRVDLALAAGADAVHLGLTDLPIRAARDLAGDRLVIGGTARDPETARRLVADGADYLGVGPTYATSTKEGLPDPIGPDAVAAIVAAVDVPVIAISGITAQRVPEVLADGCARDRRRGRRRRRARSGCRHPRTARPARSGRRRIGDDVTPDAVVVGGGIVGLAAAWSAARAGVQVTVFDPAPGAAASNVAAGMLAPVTEVEYGEEARLAMNVAAARRWPAFAEALGAASDADVGYRATGTLLVGFDRDDVAALSDLHAFQTELGLEVERLRSREARAREPMLSPRVRVGLRAGEDHRVEPRACVAALLRACGDAGVVFDDRRVARIDQRRGHVTGVRTADGSEHPAGHVVLSAGAWSDTIEGLPDEHRPAVRPVKGQLLHLRDPSGQQVLATTVRGLVRRRSVYLVPRDDGRLVVGATQEERGFDTTVTAGATRELLDDAAAIVPGVDELELVETIAGLRPTTPDNAPVIGPSAVDGLVLATGHHRNGVLLAPITADAVTAILTGAEVDPILLAAHPERTGAPR